MAAKMHRTEGHCHLCDVVDGPLAYVQFQKNEEYWRKLVWCDEASSYDYLMLTAPYIDGAVAQEAASVLDMGDLHSTTSLECREEFERALIMQGGLFELIYRHMGWVRLLKMGPYKGIKFLEDVNEGYRTHSWQHGVLPWQIWQWVC